MNQKTEVRHGLNQEDHTLMELAFVLTCRKEIVQIPMKTYKKMDKADNGSHNPGEESRSYCSPNGRTRNLQRLTLTVIRMSVEKSEDCMV